MYMAYSKNPHLPRVRMEAVRLVEQGKSARDVALHFGYSHSAVVKWVAKAKKLPHNLYGIPTESSRPRHHPNELSEELVLAVLRYREKHARCAEVLHYLLTRDGYKLSLSSVERILRRRELTNHSRWKKWHSYPPRPLPENPGILVEIDTVHDGPPSDRLYLYTMLDVCCRFGYATPSARINTAQSLGVVKVALDNFPFSITTLQSDHGPEFSKDFTKRVGVLGIAHRHSRVRTPNDNAHLERFNRTIQDECLNHIPRSLDSWAKELPKYLQFYNTERPHMGLNMATPAETLKRFQGID